MSITNRMPDHQHLRVRFSERQTDLADQPSVWQRLELSKYRQVECEQWIAQHGQRVGAMARRLAERMGFDAAFQRRAELGGSLHDIGKLTIPEAVLRKPATLTHEEASLLRKHPTRGAHMIEKIEEVREVVPAVLGHHERIDGKGYPQGIGGNQLCDLARIVAVADCFDAMTSERPYRPTKPMERVREEFKRIAGKHLDGEMVAALLSMDMDALRQELHHGL